MIAYVETVLSSPHAMRGPLEPPDHRTGWEIVSVSMGPRQFPDDPNSPFWFTIAWKVPS